VTAPQPAKPEIPRPPLPNQAAGPYSEDPEMNTQQKLIAALEARGSQRFGAHLKGCVRLTRPMGGYYFVGSKGSLRYGWVRSDSVPVSDATRAMLLEGRP